MVAAKNIITTFGTYVASLFFSIVVRTLLVRELGSTYVGLNGIFTSLLTSLSIADIGMESVLMFMLYKPLQDNNYVKVRVIVRFVHRIYLVITGVFIGFGLVLLPFLPAIVNNVNFNRTFLILVFLIYLLNASLGYLFAHDRTLLNVNQQYYLISLYQFIGNAFTAVTQIIALTAGYGFFGYSLMMLIGTLISNLLISRYVNKNLAIYKSRKVNNMKLSKTEISTLIKNSVGGISNKIGVVVVMGSDNILIAQFVSLSMVGIYSNYYLVVQTISAVIQKAIGSITSVVGAIAARKEQYKISMHFYKLSAYIYLIIMFISPILLISLTPLITIWLGNKNIMNQATVFLIVVNFVLQMYRLPSLTYIDAFGLQWYQKWKSIFESLVNILVSLLLVLEFNLGINGILLGTMFSNIFVVSWFEPYIVLKKAVKIHRMSIVAYSIISLALNMVLLVIAALVSKQNMSSNIFMGTFEKVVIMIILISPCFGGMWLVLRKNITRLNNSCDIDAK